jgi:hypothetical protein
MDNQCNTCGGFEKLDVCLHCKAAVCSNCKQSHAPYCEMAQKMKARGEGPTIANIPQGEHRRGHELVPPTEPDRHNTMPAVLGAPYDFSSTPPKVEELKAGLWAYAAKHLEPVVPPAEPIDQAIDAVKDLLGE